MGFKTLKPYYMKTVISGVSIYRLILLHILRFRAVVHNQGALKKLSLSLIFVNHD